jgi:hypothetical protein
MFYYRERSVVTRSMRKKESIQGKKEMLSQMSSENSIGSLTPYSDDSFDGNYSAFMTSLYTLKTATSLITKPVLEESWKEHVKRYPAFYRKVS